MANDSRLPIRRGARPPRKPVFDLVGDHLALDFTNTVDDRANAEPRELLAVYDDVVRWSRQSSVITDAEAKALLRTAARDPEAAARAYRRALDFRETVFAIFSAIAERRPLPLQSLERLERFAHEAEKAKSLVANGNGAQWSWNVAADDLERILSTVVESAVALLTSVRVSSVKMCEGELCSRLFLDTSQKQNRRWCDMTLCGNRAKARRHYERAKGITPRPEGVRPRLTGQGIPSRPDRVRPGLTPPERVRPLLTPPPLPPVDDRPAEIERAHDDDGFVWM